MKFEKTPEGGERMRATTPEGEFEVVWDASGKVISEKIVPSVFAPVEAQLELPKPKPSEEWPLWAKAVSLMKSDRDKGIGDTIARVIGPIGGDAYKTWYRATIDEKGCGCKERQAAYNAEFPYP